MSATAPSPQQPFSLSVVAGPDAVTLAVQGELDLATADSLDERIRDLRRAGHDQVVVDLRETTFIDSTGLRILLTARNDAKRNGHGLQLIAGPPTTQRVFELSGTRTMFDWR